MNNKDYNDIILDCVCDNLSHIMRFTYDKTDPMIMNIGLVFNYDYGFLQRLYISFKYLFKLRKNHFLERTLRIFSFDDEICFFDVVWDNNTIKKLFTFLIEYNKIYKEYNNDYGKV